MSLCDFGYRVEHLKAKNVGERKYDNHKQQLGFKI